jgi:hypothetical protein
MKIMAFANPIYENLDIKTKNNHLMLDPQLNSNYYLEREDEKRVVSRVKIIL